MSVSKTADGSSNLSTRANPFTQMDKTIAFLRASWDEFQHNVTWPKFNDLQASSTLVLVASILFALVVGLIDFVFENGLNAFYQSF